ncbi:tRNA (adenine(22)-N(1))-methyltransferase [Streptococcus pantholopis]|uniref:SAM-dependent methyltransferase n=1 Tax=Streptococcus pantholopis TaxID=1811193 RepID=A0A172Q815_9STRE|nr:tRNA (adenine(22)-N(1))-methyltransferase TrmK [Streptococcus pantholopis]AND79588.1 SAM-dependent methyltransferase [Streptococcus pantholopis]
MELRLSPRLKAVSECVPQGSRLLDIGSDHAYLPIFLLQNHQLDFAVASEVAAGPYEAALKNMTEYGLADKAAVRLADGLAALDASDQISVVSICGMGGRLITSILEAGKQKLAPVSRLILQPNNCEDTVRSWLAANSFLLKDEKLIKDSQKFYEILVAEPGKMELSSQDLRFGPILRREQPAVFKEKWLTELRKLETVLSELPEEHTERAVVSQKIKAIKEVVNESK